MPHYMEFEKELAELESEADSLRARLEDSGSKEHESAIASLERKAGSVLARIYADLTPWQKCQVARHPNRPRSSDYVRKLFNERKELAGDRAHSDDSAVIGCLARFRDRPVAVIALEKGHDTETRLQRNFGMAHPEGYRKAARLMDLADRFNFPVITFVDTPGAYPGRGAEERGQAEAIARSTQKCLQIKVPVISIVVGEGGSGGAVALAAADRVAMLEYSVYSVISPEGCASILWRDADRMRDAAEALRLTASDLLSLGVADKIIKEPMGGAQRNPAEMIAAVDAALAEMLAELDGMDAAALTESRYGRYEALSVASI